MSAESLVVTDIGSVSTKAGFLDRVDGAYRMVGAARTRSTIRPPEANPMAGVRRALEQLEGQIARPLLTPEGEFVQPEQPDGVGADGLVATTSAVGPLRVALIGLSREVSMASAQRALAGAPVRVETAIALDEENARWGAVVDPKAKELGGASQAITALLQCHPDVVVLVGGLEDGTLPPLGEMAHIVAAMCAAIPPEQARPWVIFAGNREARTLVADRIAPLTELRVTDNVRPSLEREELAPLQNELGRVLQETKIQKLPGMDELARWSKGPVTPTAQGLEYVARFLARRYGLNLLALDLGGVVQSLVTVKENRIIRAQARGLELDEFIGGRGMDQVRPWLPENVEPAAAHTSLLNQALRPWTVPMTPLEARILQVAQRAALRRAVADWRAVHYDLFEQIDLCLMSGAPLAQGFSYGALVLLVADALELGGVVSLAADPSGLAPALGAVAARNPEAAAQGIERDGFVTLGTLVAPRVVARSGAPALQVRLLSKKGGDLQIEVEQGALELIPLGPGERATVEIRPARGVELGLALHRGVFAREMQGGLLGLIIDARGRPLPLPESEPERRAKLQRWYWDVGG